MIEPCRLAAARLWPYLSFMIGLKFTRRGSRIAGASWLIAGCGLVLGSAAQADDAAIRLAPHKAIYPLTLKKVDTSSKIVGASGAIYYEMAESCSAWRTKYILILQLTREGRRGIESRTEFESTESKSGLSFTFKSKTLTNGRLSESREGRARLTGVGQGGRATYILPSQNRVILPAGIMFPNHHTIRLLQKARADERIFWAQIFDGSDDGKVSGVNALIVSKAPASTSGSPFFAAPGWRFRLSYFDMTKSGQKPTYKMLAVIRDNGVTETVELDYDDFVLEGRAKHIEPLPNARC